MSRSRSSPTATATRSISANAIARCSAGIRRSSRRRRRRRSRRSCASAWARRRCARRRRSTTRAPARWSSCSTRDGAFYFMEMNTRLQVEHPVTEAITGLDLVALQLDIAAGKPLAIEQEDVVFSGHAIEARLCAEDPPNGFMPQSGTLALWAPSPALRVEHGLRSGAEISPFYDSMIAKLIAHGADREAARAKLIHGLERDARAWLAHQPGFPESTVWRTPSSLPARRRPASSATIPPRCFPTAARKKRRRRCASRRCSARRPMSASPMASRAPCG